MRQHLASLGRTSVFVMAALLVGAGLAGCGGGGGEKETIIKEVKESKPQGFRFAVDHKSFNEIVSVFIEDSLTGEGGQTFHLDLWPSEDKTITGIAPGYYDMTVYRRPVGSPNPPTAVPWGAYWLVEDGKILIVPLQ